MENCIFCKILKGEIPCNKVYEDDYVLAFKDIEPAAPTHVLVIPKKHIRNIAEVEVEDFVYIQAITSAIKVIAEEMGLLEKGFRTVINTGVEGGQTVDHLHFHVLAGRNLEWPPG